MIKYPIGIQSFEKLREDGYVYVGTGHQLAGEGVAGVSGVQD